MTIVIQEDNMSPAQWPMGCVIKVHRGKDSIVRVVAIHTVKGTIKTTLAKICIHPIEDNNEILDINQ